MEAGEITKRVRAQNVQSNTKISTGIVIDFSEIPGYLILIKTEQYKAL